MRDIEGSNVDLRETNSCTCTPPEMHQGWRPGAFAFEKLDVFVVAREAMTRGDRLARGLPRGYSTLADQLRRALLSTYLGIAEASSRTGADRLARYRCCRGEAAEAAAALQAVASLGLAPVGEVETAITLLRRVAAMLTRMAHVTR